jgi:hypothetical protein
VTRLIDGFFVIQMSIPPRAPVMMKSTAPIIPKPPQNIWGGFLYAIWGLRHMHDMQDFWNANDKPNIIGDVV